jgi:integrase
MASLAYVNTFTDARGNTRHVFRKAGRKRVTLPGAPGSQEFEKAYRIALAGEPQTAAPLKRDDGSVNWLIDCFYDSETFKHLAPETQRRRRIDLRRLQQGDTRYHLPAVSHLPVATLPADKVALLVDKIENANMRKQFLASLRLLMKFAINKRVRADDPTAGIKVGVPKSDGFHTWTDEQIDQYRAFHRYGLLSRLVFELALELAARRSDICLLGPQHVRNGRLEYRQQKTGALVSIEISPELQAAIDAYHPKNGQLTFTATSFGKTRSYKGLSNTFADWRAEAGLPKGCVLHGLRKAHCRVMAESGCTEKEIMSHSGHKTMAEVERYTRAAEQKLLADNASAKMREARGQRSARVVAFPKRTKRARRAANSFSDMVS